MESLKSRLSKVEKERQELRDEVRRFRQAQTPATPLLAEAQTNSRSKASVEPPPRLKPSDGHSESRVVLGELSPNKAMKKNDGHALGAKKSSPNPELEKEHRLLKAKFSKLDDNYKAVVSRLRSVTKRNEEWVEYSESLERMLDVLKGRPAAIEGGRDLMESVQPDDISIGDYRRTPDNREAEVGRRSNRASSTISTRRIDSRPDASRTAVRKTVETVGLEQSALEVPQLRTVARSVAKCLTDATESDVTESQNRGASLPPLPAPAADDVVRIKAEASSDAPVVVFERVVRKRKREDEEGGARRVKTEDPDSDPIILGQNIREFEPQESMDLDEIGYRLETPKKKRTVFGPPVDTGIGATADDLGEPALEEAHSDVYEDDAAPDVSGLRLPPRNEAIRNKHQDLVEDGFDERNNPGESGTPGDDMLAKPPGRLASLLNTPSDQPRALRNPPANAAHRRPLSPFRSAIPQRRFLPFADEGQQVGREETPTTRLGSAFKQIAQLPTPTTPSFLTSRNQQNSRGRSSLVTPGSTEASSLRSRPLSSLRKDDFKPNSRLNSGVEYAYTEVVRNKEERAGLPGCTDPQCCGPHFRALALAQRKKSTPAEDRKLLEEYLGDQSWQLGQMEPAEKEKVWVEAKTQELADKYSKHRHRYPKMRSPPGYWDTDFPTSQEIEKEKAEAEAREKGLTEERYREAMKPGGRWTFRDE